MTWKEVSLTIVTMIERMQAFQNEPHFKIKLWVFRRANFKYLEIL